MFTEMCCLYLDILIGGGICWLAVAKVDIFLKPANILRTFFTHKIEHSTQSESRLLIINSFGHDNLHKKIA